MRARAQVAPAAPLPESSMRSAIPVAATSVRSYIDTLPELSGRVQPSGLRFAVMVPLIVPSATPGAGKVNVPAPVRVTSLRPLMALVAAPANSTMRLSPNPCPAE